MNDRSTPVSPDSWISFRKAKPEARLRLFCVPHAGAGALTFRTWSDSLPADVEICPIQLPGRGSRLAERPFTRLAPLVETLASALGPLLDRPFALFGHSLGALISFELARRIRSRYGLHPAHLFVSAGRAPHIPHRHAPMHALADEELLAALHRLAGTPGELLGNAEWMQIMLPVLRADFAVYETYEHVTEPPLACPISAFGGLQDHRVGPCDLDAWRSHTDAAFALRMFSGDHFFFLKEPLLLQEISRELAR